MEGALEGSLNRVELGSPVGEADGHAEASLDGAFDGSLNGEKLGLLDGTDDVIDGEFYG